MNIAATKIETKALKESAPSSTQSSASSASGTNSFKDELETVKSQEKSEANKTAETAKDEDAETAQAEEKETASVETKITTTLQTAEEDKKTATEKNSLTNLAQQIEKGKLEKKNNLKETKEKDPVEELSSKIAKLNEIKNSSNHIQAAAQKTEVATDYDKSMQMDNNDITFFVDLVQNQNNSAQGVQINTAGPTLTDIKAEVTQKTVQVSATLMSALDESMKTNKPFRIDFGKDIAVIMKVDKDGVLSANFIPGSGAVEAYLKNNLASLKQNFDDQGLQYNELSYSNQQKQKQKNNKEKKDE